METITNLIKDTPIPKMVKVRQNFDKTCIPESDIPGIITRELDRPEIGGKIQPGQKIAITCGSRGINHNAVMARAIVDFVKSKGAEPYIVAAMGSHGGATAEGQLQILKDYGVTEEAMGCPVKSSMETVQIGISGVRHQPVFMDKNASEADGIILFNRIKPHTSFRGPYESGLMKMMAIGLGKLFGFTFEENFNLPYLSRSITEFWRRWHISLGTWFRDYVYIPLGGNRCGWGRQLFNIAVVWLLTGLWHGASWNFVLWGAYYAVLLMVEKLGLLRVLARLPRMLQHAYALFFIVVGWALFACTEPGQLSGVFGALFGLSGVPLYDASSLFLLKNNVLLWLLLVFASTASFARLHTHLLSRHWYAEVLCPLGLAAALLACTAFIVSGSFNPFLYFRF